MSDAAPPSHRPRLTQAFAPLRTSPVPRVWLAALAVGVVAGYAAIGFRLAIGGVQFLWIGESAENLFRFLAATPPWLVVAGPTTAGLTVGLWLTFVQPQHRALGVADAMHARALGGGHMPVWQGLGSALVSVVSLGGGASAGREGPAVHLGATLGSFLAARFGFSAPQMRTLLAAGAAAAVAASFNAPIAGVLFALEVVLGHYALRASGPIVIASVTGALLARFHLGSSPTFVIPDYLITGLLDFPAFALLGVVSAGVAIIFMVALMHADTLACRIAMPLWLRPVVGGLLIGVIGIWYPHVLGVGYAATDAALQGQLALGLLMSLVVVKTIATAITLASRFGGGVFSPSLYVGAMTGGAFGMLITQAAPEVIFSTPEVYAIVGMGAVAGAVLGAPLSTLLIAFELTGGYAMTVALMMAISIATALTQGLLGKSFFHWQLERRGLRLYGGPRWRILQTVRVHTFLQRVAADDATPLQQLDPEDTRLLTDDTLDHALALFAASGQPSLPVVHADAPLEIIGTATHVGALEAYSAALVEAAREEHE